MMIRSTFSALALSTILAVAGSLPSTASAHSDYWECARNAGSADAVAGACGQRSDYDRTGELGGANTPTEAQRQEKRNQEERQRQDDARREDDRRREETRRDDDRRRDDLRRETDRLEEENRRRRQDSDSTYERPTYERPTRASKTRRGSASTGESRSKRQVEEQVDERVSYESDMVIPVAVNQRAPSLNIGSYANLSQYKGYRIKGVKVETSTPGNSRVNVMVHGVRVGSIIAQQPGEYEKDFYPSRALVKSSSSNLVLKSQGDVTILSVTVTIGR